MRAKDSSSASAVTRRWSSPSVAVARLLAISGFSMSSFMGALCRGSTRLATYHEDMKARCIWLACIMLIGCGGEDETAPPPPSGACRAGELERDDGSCQPAGLPTDMACPPGEWLSEAMECIPAGVPPDGCGAGFVHTGDRGCEAVLPGSPCGPGLVALAGGSRFRGLASCGNETFGHIPLVAGQRS